MRILFAYFVFSAECALNLSTDYGLRRLEDEGLVSAPPDRLTRDIHQEIGQLTGEDFA